MQTHNLLQGSPEWLAHRMERFNASEAAAMLGVSPHMTRTQLLECVATGIRPEPSLFEQELFNEGHRAEALARPKAEAILGEDLYPLVGTEGRLSASFDGLTMLHDQGFEHKLLNNELRACMVDGCTGTDLPLYHQVQMEQQLLVSAAERILFMASEWTRDGICIEARWCWYEPNLELRDRIVRGWELFAEDLAKWKPEAAAEVVEPTVIQALPALVVQVQGRVVTSNLAPFREAAEAFLAKIKTDLQTDQDFVDADRTVKFCHEGEQRLELVKQQALAQTATIDELFRTVDQIKEQMRQKRLMLEKLVDARKKSIRTEHVANGQAELDAHILSLNGRLGSNWIPRTVAPFAEAIKSKRTVASVKEAVAVTLADAKIAASALADRLELNRRALRRENGTDWMFLFADFATVGTKPAEDFAAIAAQRIKAHQDRQAEEQRQRELEEQRQAAAAAPAPAPAHAPAAPIFGGGMVQAYSRDQTIAVAGQAVAVIDAPERQADVELPKLKLGDINERLGFTLTREFIEQTLKIEPAETRQRAVMFHGADYPRICRALVEHIQRSV